MAATYYSPFIPAFNSNGAPLPGAKIAFFLSGTSTPTPIYADEGLTTQLPNPVPSDAAAKYPNIYLDETITYRVIQTDANGVQLGDAIDPYVPGQALKGDAGPTGPANSTYTTLAALKAAAVTNVSYIFAPPSGSDGGAAAGTFLYQTAGAPYTADGVNVVKLNGVPLTTGALVRQGTVSVNFDGRSADAKLREVFSVTDARFAGGAKADGTTDNYAAIVTADIAAAAAGKELFWPAGTYATRQIPDARASWRGEGVGRTIIKGLVGSTPPTGYQPLVTWDGRDNIRVSDMTFDGSVSADPVPVTSANFNSYTGFGGPTINNGRNARYERVASQNASWHGLRFYRVTGGSITDCATKRTRGNFGDGILVLSSADVVVDRCNMNDFARGGGVADRFNESEPLCQRVWFTNCTVSNGHDASVLYGGLEYNFGIWAENTVGITVDAVKTRDVLHRGVIAVSGQKTADYTDSHANMKIANCEVSGSEAGITVSSLVDLPVDAKVSRCSVTGAQFGYSIQAKVAGDRFTLTECDAEYNAASAVGQGFSIIVAPGLSAPPLITIGDGCTVGRSATNATFLTTTDPNAAITADVGNANNNGGAMALSVTSLRTQDGSPVYLRWHGNVAHFISLTYVDWHCAYGSQSGGEVNVRGCKTRGVNLGNASIVTFDLGTIMGGLGGQNVRVAAGVIYQNADTDISTNARIIFESTMGANKPAIHIGGRLHQKDIAANGPIWQIEDTANARTFFNGCRWLSKSATSTPNAWAEFRTGNFTASEVRADDAVTTIFNPVGATGGAATYPGVTKIPMR